MEPNWDACTWFNSAYSPLLYEKYFSSSIDILLAYTRLKIISTPSICWISSSTVLISSPVAILFPFPCPKNPLFFLLWCQLLFLLSSFLVTTFNVLVHGPCIHPHIRILPICPFLAFINIVFPAFPSIVPELCCHFKNIINIHCLVAGSFWVPQLLWQECASPQQAVPYLVSHHSSVDAGVKLWEGLRLCKGIMFVQWSFKVSYVFIFPRVRP